MMRSKYAGGGKSHIAKYFSKLGYKTLFVVPQSNLSQNIQDDAVTTKFSLYLWVTANCVRPQGNAVTAISFLNLITASTM